MENLEGIRKILLDELNGFSVKCRVSLFFILNDNQHFLYFCYDSEKGFLKEFEGLKLFVTEHFGDLLKKKDEFEITCGIKSNYPFLYEGFGTESSLFVKKIYVGSQLIGFLELLTDLPFVTDETKELADRLIFKMSHELPKVHLSILNEVSRRFVCLNALNLIKTIRPRTFYHSFRVADLAVKISENMGLDEQKIKNIYFAALIHDVGEIWIPNDILDKRDKLTDEELELVKSHPLNLKHIFLHNPFLEDIVNIALYHHERIDGKGYYGLKGEEIPIESRVLAICEFVDGLHTDRPDRPGLKVDQIVHYLKKLKGEAFDEEIVDIAIPIIETLYERKTDFRGIMSGKPVILIFYKNGDLNLVKGVVEYSAGNNLGISLATPEGKKLGFRDRVRMQVPVVSKIMDIVAEVLSASEDIVNLSIVEKSEIEDKPLEVYWEFDILVVPLKFMQKASAQNVNKVVKMRTSIFGTKSLLAKSKDAVFSIGDTVLIKAKPKNEVISIPAVVSDVIDDGGIYTVRFEYFGLNESEDAKVHRAIYSRQVELTSS